MTASPRPSPHHERGPNVHADLGTSGDNVRRVKVDEFIRSHATGTAKTELHTVSVERGLSFEASQDLWKELVGKDEGYYLSNQVSGQPHCQTASLAHSVRLVASKVCPSK